MSRAMKIFLLYGLFGQKVLNGIAEERHTFLCVAILLVAAGIACEIYTKCRKNKKYFAALMTVLAFIALLGTVSIAALLIVWLLFKLLAAGGETKPAKLSAEDRKERRNDELWLTVNQSYGLEDCLSERSRAAYEAQFISLLDDPKSTEEDIRAMRDRWEWYYNHPEWGSKRYKELHPDE